MYTLSSDDWFSLFAVWLLFAAELYAAVTHIIGCIVNAFPLERPELSLSEFSEHDLPSVDVMVPTYDEDANLLEVTLRAAKMLDYPKSKLRIHLLDDGGTDQKVNQTDAFKASKALKRRNELQNLCISLDVEYHTREVNVRAKAGNINSAFSRTNADIILILDADHVPTADFLDKTVPWMIKNDKVFLVQTPHFMANPDPIERNYFSAFTRMPSENDMFYGTIQKGLDYWSSSFFCGSAAILRRKHLELVGGLSGDSITEDAESALDLHSLGYESVYVNRPMVSGLAPETFSAFIQQRMRWAQGMTQILLLKKPFKDKGLDWHQKLGYMSSILFWLFPFSRIVFMLMPLAYLVFGMQIYRASLLEILAFTLPHIVSTYMVSTMLFGKTRWPLVSEMYEMLQCTFTLKAISKVFIKPKAPSFVVTPKGNNLEKDFVSPLSGIFYILVMLLLIATVAGVYKLIYEPLTLDLTIVVLLWNSFNLVLLLALLSVLIERRQVRNQARFFANDNMSLQASDGRAWMGNLVDISLGGALVQLNTEDKDLPNNLHLVGWSKPRNQYISIPALVLGVNCSSNIARIKFEDSSDSIRNDIISYVLGNSDRWQSFQTRRTRPISYLSGVKRVLSVSFRPLYQHFIMQFKQIFNRTVKEHNVQ